MNIPKLRLLKIEQQSVLREGKTADELEIIRNRDLQQAIFNQSADAIFLVDTETLLITDCNHRAVELFAASSKAELINIEGQTLQKQSFTPDELATIVEAINRQGFWSREIEYITKDGYSMSEILGQDVFEQVIKPRFDQCLAGQKIQYEMWFENPEKEAKFLSVTYAPYLEADQTISGVLLSIRDITDRNRAEQMLDLQAVITRNMAEGICLVRSADGMIVYTNPKFEQMFGYDSHELIGQHISVVNYANEKINAIAKTELPQLPCFMKNSIALKNLLILISLNTFPI